MYTFCGTIIVIHLHTSKHTSADKAADAQEPTLRHNHYMGYSQQKGVSYQLTRFD